jgi:SUN domain-containing protein 1/2
LKEDFGHWNDSTILLRDNLEATLIKVADDLRRDILLSTTEQLRHLAEGETEKTVELILTDVVNRITSKNLTKSVHENASSSSDYLAREEIEKMVRNALVVYDADKTGLFDFALETAGGAVVSTRCTETYVRTGASYTLFGIPIWWPSNNPRTAIQVRSFRNHDYNLH